MSGPEGLKVGMVVYQQPELDGLDETDKAADWWRCGKLVVEWGDGELGLVSVSPHLYGIAKGEVSILPKGTKGSFAYVTVHRVEADDEWFHTIPEALIVAAKKEEEYAAECTGRASLARRIAGETSPANPNPT